MTKQICKELGIKPEELHRYPALQQLIKEYEEIKVFQKALQRMLGVDRVVKLMGLEDDFRIVTSREKTSSQKLERID